MEFFFFLVTCRQISIDCEFLESQQIIDYSLLLGLHFRAPEHLKALLELPTTATNSDSLPRTDGIYIVFCHKYAYISTCILLLAFT